jgi:hypothetical protein
MIIRPVARNTTAPTYTCALANPYCLSNQRESNNSNNNSNTTTTTTTHTPLLTHRNLVGVLIIAALLALGLILWLCFGKWSKPIRHFLRGESRHRHTNDATVRFGIGDGLAPGPIDRNGATTATVSKAPGPRGNNDAAATGADSDDAEKQAGMVDSCSSQSSLDHEEIRVDDKDEEVIKAKLEPEPALPAKVR